MALTDWKQAAQKEIESFNEAKITDENAAILSAWITIARYKGAKVDSGDEDDTLKKAIRELRASEDYIVEYLEDKDVDYLTMANDRKSHYAKFAKILLDDGVNIDDLQAKAQEIEQRIAFYAKGAV